MKKITDIGYTKDGTLFLTNNIIALKAKNEGKNMEILKTFTDGIYNVIYNDKYIYIIYRYYEYDTENVLNLQAKGYFYTATTITVQPVTAIPQIDSCTIELNHDITQIPRYLWIAIPGYFLDDIEKATTVFAKKEAFKKYRDKLWETMRAPYTKTEIDGYMDKLNSLLTEPLNNDQMKFLKTTYGSKNFVIEKKFDANAFAEFLAKNANIKKIEGSLYVYKNGIYKRGRAYLENETREISKELTSRQRREVSDIIDLIYADEDYETEESPVQYIAFKNGIYDFVNDKLIDFTPDIVIRNKIPFNYNKNATSPVVDQALNNLSCNNAELRALMEEAIGYTFLRRNELRASFMLTGGKSNGKSTYLSLISHILGQKNISTLSLENLNDKFMPASLVGKLANIGDDIADNYINNLDTFKKLVTGDAMQVQEKFEKDFTFKCYAKMFFSANSLPRLNDKTGAVMSRIIVIPFKATFSKDDPNYDPYIKDKLLTQESTEYLIRLGIEGLKRVWKNKNFTKNDISQEEWDEYTELNNPILVFFKDFTKEELIGRRVNEFYQDYRDFCIVENLKELGKGEFSKQVKLFYGIEAQRKRVEGKREYFYGEIKDQEETQEIDEETIMANTDDDIPF